MANLQHSLGRISSTSWIGAQASSVFHLQHFSSFSPLSLSQIHFAPHREHMAHSIQVLMHFRRDDDASAHFESWRHRWGHFWISSPSAFWLHPFYLCSLPLDHFNILLATFPTSLLQPGCQRDRILVVCQSSLTMENISCQPKTNQQIPQRSDILKVYQLTSSLSNHCCKHSTASLSARGSIISHSAHPLGHITSSPS